MLGGQHVPVYNITVLQYENNPVNHCDDLATLFIYERTGAEYTSNHVKNIECAFKLQFENSAVLAVGGW